MVLLSNFDPFEDFWEVNPQARIVFASEYPHTPSQHMWAAALFAHPESKLFNEDPITRQALIVNDYLKDPSFDFSSLTPLIEKFKQHVLTKAQLLLSNWERRMYEREAFLDSLSYDTSTYELLEKMNKETPNMWKAYLQILAMLSKEDESKVEGDIEESLLEKGVLS